MRCEEQNGDQIFELLGRSLPCIHGLSCQVIFATTFSRTAGLFPVETKQIPPLYNSRTPEDKFPASVESTGVLPKSRELSFQIYPIQNTLSQPKELY